LHISSQNGLLDVVQILIDTGVAVNIRNGTQKTPFALASINGKVEVGRFLTVTREGPT
jgi:ankyrin repeat protein